MFLKQHSAVRIQPHNRLVSARCPTRPYTLSGIVNKLGVELVILWAIEEELHCHQLFHLCKVLEFHRSLLALWRGKPTAENFNFSFLFVGAIRRWL